MGKGEIRYVMLVGLTSCNPNIAKHQVGLACNESFVSALWLMESPYSYHSAFVSYLCSTVGGPFVLLPMQEFYDNSIT